MSNTKRTGQTALSLYPFICGIAATARSGVTTAKEKMTTPLEKTTTAEKNVTTPSDNSNRQN